MSFTNPVMLWSLLALAPLVAIYFLKVRPRRRPTTAYFLWQKIVQDRRPNRLLYRLRDLWSLLLMALAFAAIALALAGPRWTNKQRKDLLILIDNSASMQAADGGSTRLERAKERAADIARALDGVQRAAVATVAHELRYQSHLTDNPRELLAAIERIEPTAEEFRIDALPRSVRDREDENKQASWANSEQRRKEAKDEEIANKAPEAFGRQHRILLISDGAFDAEKLPDGVELSKVGRTVDNVGIIAADLRFIPGGVKRLGFYFQLGSTRDEPLEADLLLSREIGGQEQLVKVIPVTIAPGVNPPQVFTIDDAEPGRWIAQLDVEDALEVDNTAYLAARKAPPIPISVAATDRFFLDQSVLAFSREDDLLELVEGDGQITLAQGTVPEAQRAIIFHPAGESPWWESLGGEMEVAAPRVVVEDHPLLRHVDATTIHFIGARALEAPRGSQVLVESEDGVPLIYVVTRTGTSAVVVNLDPVAAEFYYSAWFPVLVHAAAAHLAGREEPLLAVYTPSAGVPIPGASDDTSSRLTTPSGESLEVHGDRLSQLSALGFYKLDVDDAQWLLASSTLSPAETLLNGAASDESAEPIEQGSPPAHKLTLFAVLLLTVESLLYHRRKVG